MIRRQLRQKQRQQGFTLTEVLVTVGILIILLGISLVTVAAYIKYLRITELDNAAREIYLAAENRAVLLENRQQGDTNKQALLAALGELPVERHLEGVDLVEDGEASDTYTLYYIHKDDTDIIDLLLPEGSIDPALWDGDFYIVYEPTGGNVTDVFFNKETLTQATDDFKGFYETWSNAPRNSRMNQKPMIGYYGSGTIEKEDIGALRTPVIQIINEDTLTVEVTYRIPPTMASQVSLAVDLEYQGQTISLTEEVTDVTRYSRESRLIAGYQEVTCTWLLDSLKEDLKFAGLFKDSIGTPAPGGDFKVTATTMMAGTEPSSSSAEDNSLFAKGSGGDTAGLLYYRHVQNLDEEFSGVQGKTAAEQKGDINCLDYRKNKYYADYEHKHIPIVNDTLTRYESKTGSDGDEGNRRYELRNLSVSVDSGDAGLFQSASGKEFVGVRMVNTAVSASNGNAGALIGSAESCTFDDCRVYWENEPGETDLTGTLGDSATHYNYKITGATCGGLAGQVSGTTNIGRSSASTLLQGSARAGGLVGNAQGSVTVTSSYADSYLAGSGNAAVLAGLVCAADGSNIVLTNCYTAGFASMDNAQRSAGLVTGGGTISLTNAYSVLQYTAASKGEESGEENKRIYPLTENTATKTNAFYLTIPGENEGKLSDTQILVVTDPAAQKSYSEMTGADMGDAFEVKTFNDSHPYNLQAALNLTTYDFPGLAGMPHYGDWTAQFLNPSLVYFEQYQGSGEYRFKGGNLNCLKKDTDTGNIPVTDGYAMAFLDNNDFPSDKLTLTYTFNGQNFSREYARNSLPTVSHDGYTYLLAPLPDELVNVTDATLGTTTVNQLFSRFYVELTVKRSDTAQEYGYYYNPHFAGTAVVKNGNEAPNPRGLAISVRTPRHLNDLSLYQCYYGANNNYTFLQELDLDYQNYTGYKLFDPDKRAVQPAIGTLARPFDGIYNGGCHKISNVDFTRVSGERFVGLFGCTTNTLRNIVYEMDPKTPLQISVSNSSMPFYVGGLVGGNGGTITNCAVSGVNLSGGAYGVSLYLGALAGRNHGLIQQCGAEAALLNGDGSNFASVYAGGLIGENSVSGSIAGSYVVGRVSVQGDRTSSVVGCGFAGASFGRISQSYSAVGLEANGEQSAQHGFSASRGGVQSNAFYLNNVNLNYREFTFNSDYASGIGIPERYEGLTEDGITRTQLRMEKVEGSTTENPTTVFPYFTAVKNKDEKPIHYGLWPVKMSLDHMGVYYWEKLMIGDKESYHVRLSGAEIDQKYIFGMSTLSNVYNDGGSVVDYGYGYYHRDGFSVEVTTTNLYYSEKGGNTGTKAEKLNAAWEDTDVNGELRSLMPGYTFHSFHSYGMGESGAGLYPGYTVYSTTDEEKDSNIVLHPSSDVNYDKTVKFDFNPLFAGAVHPGVPYGWKIVSGGEASADEIGSEKNPYQVRAVSQLQNINWNPSKASSKEVLTAGNTAQFPYLSRSSHAARFYWEQTHDIDGTGQTHSPIAEYYDATHDTQGNLNGWFGGVYDGNDYQIRNLNIKGSGEPSSVAGLFGVVYNGTLKNIILYADRETTVTATYNTGTQTAWYAIGTLAGLAASDSDTAIEKCAVSGYTVDANFYIYSGAGQAWGGAEVGGLVGISNMDLKGCTAVTTISIPGSARNPGDNSRIGGLAGASQKTISGCYAGGEISVADTTDGLLSMYIGGLVGGSYFKPLQPAGGKQIGIVGNDTYNNRNNTTNNAISNCYSYVKLPSIPAGATSAVNPRIISLYALGGTGEINSAALAGTNWNTYGASNQGVCTITNSYYLDSAIDFGGKGTTTTSGTGFVANTSVLLTKKNRYISIKTDIASSGVTALTYQQMADQITADGLFARLGGDFAPVTTVTADGYSVAGRYSYVPINNPLYQNLQGLNYPFPTILTQAGNHVHYGRWPLYGIDRQLGAQPIDLDLFQKKSVTEQLKTSDGIAAGGTWSWKVADEDLAEAEMDQSGKLIVTGKKVGSTSVTVTYALGTGQSYSISVPVNITAVLMLRSEQSPVLLHTDDSAVIRLHPYGKDNSTILDLAALGITLLPDKIDLREDELHYNGLSVEQQSNGDVLLLLTTTGTAEDCSLSFNFAYQYQGTEYSEIGIVPLHVTKPEISPEPPLQVDGTLTATLDFNAAVQNATVISADSTVFTVTSVPAGNGVTLNLTGAAEGTSSIIAMVNLRETNGVSQRVVLNIPVTVTAAASGGPDRAPARPGGTSSLPESSGSSGAADAPSSVPEGNESSAPVESSPENGDSSGLVSFPERTGGLDAPSASPGIGGT